MVKYHERFKLVHGYRVREHPNYNTWSNMKRRCNDITNQAYKNYGGRGIKVCERWMESFENFANDMGVKPEGYSIDRIDNDKGYYLENCKWSNYQEQAINKRIYKTNSIGYPGIKLKKNGSYTAIYNIENKRYNLGSFLTIKDALVARTAFYNLFFSNRNEALKMTEKKVSLKSTTGITGINGNEEKGFKVNITENKIRKYLGYSKTLEGAKKILDDYNDKR